MNCQSFENIVSELVRDGLLDADTGRDGLKHADECGVCAERLLDERFLSNSFKGIASADAQLQASSSTESALLGAFRSAQAISSSGSSVTVFPAAKKRYHWLVAAAAASVTVLFAVAGMRFLSSRTGVSPQAISAPVAGITQEPSLPPVERAPSVEQPLGSREIAPVEHPSSRPGRGVRSTTSESGERPANSPFRTTPKNSGYSPRQQVASASNNEPQEIATDFIPVSYSSALTSVEGGRVVRVELPRSALASFGLPMNMTEASGRVKADVLMDDFGTARAIRFVR
jgi:hypothetical protein